MQDFVPIGLLCLKSALDARDLPVESRVVEVNALINSGLITNGDDFHTRVAEQLLLAGDDLIGLMTDPILSTTRYALPSASSNCRPRRTFALVVRRRPRWRERSSCTAHASTW